ncbi:MAG TPA: nucleotidyltransferase substrate binding protein [Chlamydiales bacterium]|nr:nucleotidyltransferase substrate binding protein [Chlamydiales bacterium]
MDPDVRWKQRFANFERAFLFLQAACEKEAFTQLEEAGVVQAFEFTFELAWKTLKDYLEAQGLSPQFPRHAIKDGFQTGIIKDGTLWIEMLDKRNELSHTYDEVQAKKALMIVQKRYFPAIHQLYLSLKKAHE